MRDDKIFMRLTLKLAKKGLGLTSPNPIVGAVVVKGNRVIGTGFHKKAGLAHAEVAALNEAKADAKGATLYVNLEPCNHFGRTPPCTKAIINSGIKKVVVAMQDPSPITKGKGFRSLKKAGIAVTIGILESEAKRLNEVFIKYVTKKTPFVIAKVAQSLDGKIATRAKDSKWISNEKSRRYVHELRGQVDAVMVGLGTVISDNPLLTGRLIQKGREGKHPVKVIVDSSLKTPIKSRIFTKDSPAKVIMATTERAPKPKINKFQKIGCEVLVLKEKKGMVDLKQLLRKLREKEIASVLVEGGGELIGNLADERLIDKFLIFIAPKIIGGRGAVTSVEGVGIRKIRQALVLKDLKNKRFGTDLLIEGYSRCLRA